MPIGYGLTVGIGGGASTGSGVVGVIFSPISESLPNQLQLLCLRRFAAANLAPEIKPQVDICRNGRGIGRGAPIRRVPTLLSRRDWVARSRWIPELQRGWRFARKRAIPPLLAL